jgi:apolipoprotein N-acyltransferase
VHSFRHGQRTAPLPTRLGAAGILVCNEGMLPEVAAQRVRDGARFLVNPSNDSWLGRERWGVMMFELISVRAIEQRRYLVRASTSGPSAIVDPWGRVRVRTEPLSRAVTVGWIQPRSDRTVYGRVGDAFAFGCVLVAFGALLLVRPRGDAAASCAGEG